MSVQDTPRASRLHIGLFGNRNAGKSSLINALTGQEISLVSPVAGTTTDPVYQAFELPGVGPVVFLDTAGWDDRGELGSLRSEKTRQAMEKTDLALLVLSGQEGESIPGLDTLREKKVPVLAVLNKSDLYPDSTGQAEALSRQLDLPVLAVSAKTGANIPALRQAMADLLPDSFWELSITGDLVKDGDLVLLVMPQDIQAPKGRLILPQVQTIRELLDKKCTVVSCTADQLVPSLAAMVRSPKLIITDSQAFPVVWEQKPKESLLTSFSILFAGYKGDIKTFLAGAAAIDRLTEDSNVLIAEACAHAPQEEDIGRVKIPRLLRAKVGAGLSFDFVRGSDFPEDLSPYDLVIHCGACMFNRRHVISRIAQAERQQVPICNYGVVLAHLTGILDKVSYPGGSPGSGL